jgi:hypothetical protein
VNTGGAVSPGEMSTVRKGRQTSPNQRMPEGVTGFNIESICNDFLLPRLQPPKVCDEHRKNFVTADDSPMANLNKAVTSTAIRAHPHLHWYSFKSAWNAV